MKKDIEIVSQRGTSPSNVVTRRRAVHDKLLGANDGDRALGNERISSIAILNKSMQAQFKQQALAFQRVLGDIPELASTDVIRLCIHLALQKEDYESAARWAKELVEFERPKLSRREVIETDESKEMTDEELEAELRKEGVVVSLSSAVSRKSSEGFRKSLEDSKKRERKK